MSGAVGRENQIFETLRAFKETELEFVVVGGYAVSAFQHRFSVDADLVIQERDVEKFTDILEENGFEEVEDRELDPDGDRYLAYEKNRELPVTIDLLVNSLKCRQTDASWSYQYFKEHSTTRKIDGTEKSIEVEIPEKELLIAVKLHSGRLTDARDVVALADQINREKVVEHLDRGDRGKLAGILTSVNQTMDSDNFEDAFKGVFQQGTLPRENIQKIQDIIHNYR